MWAFTKAEIKKNLKDKKFVASLRDSGWRRTHVEMRDAERVVLKLLGDGNMRKGLTRLCEDWLDQNTPK